MKYYLLSRKRVEEKEWKIFMLGTLERVWGNLEVSISDEEVPEYEWRIHPIKEEGK